MQVASVNVDSFRHWLAKLPVTRPESWAVSRFVTAGQLEHQIQMLLGWVTGDELACLPPAPFAKRLFGIGL